VVSEPLTVPAPTREADLALLGAVAESLVDLPYVAWSFGDSVGFEGLLAASALTGDDRWLTFARGMFRGWASRQTPFVRMDCTAPGLAMVDAYRETGDSQILDAALQLAKYLRGRPTVDGVYATWDNTPLKHPYGPGQLPAEELKLLVAQPAGVFVDCLHFDPPFFTALGAATGDEELIRAGIEQAEGYVRLLQDPESGLFFHFFLEGQAAPYILGWGRGQGWALLGLLDVIERVGDRALCQRLIEAAAKLVHAMVATQRPDGDWYAVVHRDWSGDESSTAAFMIAGFLRAAELGVVDIDVVADAVAGAERAMRSHLDDALLRGVSAAVWACTQESHYGHVARDFIVPWGQGPVALALSALLGHRDGRRPTDER
jgi:unsaturated rhamnogalacturonyl hydrolase